MAATFVVEDGSGLVNANSLVDLAYADQYFDNYGAPPTWTNLSDADKQTKLRLATQYVEAQFGDRWDERPTHPLQKLSWPRAFMYDRGGFALRSDVIPDAVKDAVCYLALQAASGDTLLPDPTAGNIASESVSVGQGAVVTSTSYVGGKGVYKVYTIVNRLLRQFLRNGSGDVERG